MTSDQFLTYFKIFIVEDSPLVAERLTTILREWNQLSVVGHASNSSSALSFIPELSPDAVILDINLKGNALEINGIDLLAMLRKDYPDMLIIMLTNHTNSFYFNKCKELGANYFFDKSNDFEKIPVTIKKHIARQDNETDI